MGEKKSQERKMVSPCYDHLGGRLGKALFQFLVEQEWIKKSSEGRNYDITEKGWKELKTFGIDIYKLRSSRRKIISACIERSGENVYEHTGAYLGALLAERLFDFGWLAKKEEKDYEITEKGWEGIESLDIEMKKV
jgi:predicted transcriptional regulator